jgi:molybdopterin-guanine dinucleotide biosynthesis protein A
MVMRAMTNDTLAIILGGGQGSRLFPLTATRSKPAVPIGGKYRLIDVPISGLPACGHPPYLRPDTVQFSVAQPPHLEHVSPRSLLGRVRRDPRGRADTDNPNWYQGTADAVRQAARHFAQHEAQYYLILAGDHLYRMDYCDLVDAHKAHKADITIAAQPVDAETATQMGSSGSSATGRLSRSRRNPSRRDCRRSAAAYQPDRHSPSTATIFRSWRRWASTSSRATSCWRCWNEKPASISAAS